MSDLLEEASSALGTPVALVQRSAAARAAVDGTTAEDVLAAWAGGAPAATQSPGPPDETTAQPDPPTPEPEDGPSEADEPAPVPEPVAAPIAVMVEVEPEPEAVLEPVPLATRMRTAVRVGSWVGAGLGLVGFLAAGGFWASAAVIPGEGSPVVVEAASATVLAVFALVSVVFGAIVASVSRAAASWRDPAMQLSGSRSATAWTGAAIGLVLGIAGAAMVTGGLGTPVGEEGDLVHLPVLGTLATMVFGGAVLGAITAAIPQLLGTPVAIPDDERTEAETMRRRLADTIGVPLAGLAILALLVLPFAYALIQSNHLTANGGAVVAVITAGGILGFAALSGNRPNVRITLGELMVAVAGIGTVLLIILAVLVFRGAGDDEHAEPAESSAIVVVV